MKINVASVTLGLGSLVTISISLVCSYWFLFSVFGGEGYRAIGAGLAGCAIQLFSYGFSLYLPRETRAYMIPLWLVLCLMSITMSMFATYTTIYSHISSNQEKIHHYEQGNQLIMNLLEESKKDKEIIRGAAEQGLAERYRTQSTQFVQRNQEIMQTELSLLDRIDERTNEIDRSTPMNGVVEIIGTSAMVLTAFCIWIAFMFDALPLFALNAISRISNVSSQARNSDMPVLLEVNTPIPEMVNEERIHDSSSNTKKEIVSEPIRHLSPIKKEAQKKQNAVCVKKVEDDTKMPYEKVVAAIREQKVVPNYASIQEFSGYTRWQAQDFCRRAIEDNIIERDGRGFKVKEQLLRVVHPTAVSS